MTLYNHHVEFLTATILRWQRLLADDRYKQTIVDALNWLVREDRCHIFGFVIMPNHIHLLWRMNNRHARREVQGALLSFTGHQFKQMTGEDGTLRKHFVADKDRLFQFWERDSFVKECWSEPFLVQKLDYIHRNPCQPHWQLATVPEDYRWSSAAFYMNGDQTFPWLRHYAA